MKKYYVVILQVIAICIITADVHAFDDKVTHPAITEAATLQSVLVKTDYLKNNLGFNNGYKEEIANDPEHPDQPIAILQVLKNGARTEDTGTLPPTSLCKRGLNHFYNPQISIANFDIKAGGLSDEAYLYDLKSVDPDVPYIANIKWATVYTGFDFKGEKFNPDPSEDEQKTIKKEKGTVLFN